MVFQKDASKCFRNTFKTIKYFNRFPNISDYRPLIYIGISAYQNVFIPLGYVSYMQNTNYETREITSYWMLLNICESVVDQITHCFI